jgi:hypothetical protein
VSERKQVNAREELNAIRSVVFGPPIGSRLLLNENTRLTLAGHLNRLEQWCERAHTENALMREKLGRGTTP